MASSENDRHQDDSANRRRAARNRKIEPPREAPQTERGLTHSPYFNGPLYQRMSEDQLRKFFLHLKNDKSFASGSLRVAFSGVKFFYTCSMVSTSGSDLTF